MPVPPDVPQESFPIASAPVTAVIFSRNRPQLLSGAIGRFGAQRCPLVVCDGSGQPLRPEQQGTCEYVHRPGASIWQRISEGLARVTTPFAILAADDDLLVVPTMRLCADFLSDRTAAVRACGTTTHVAWNDRDFSRAIADLRVERAMDLHNPQDPLERLREVHDRNPQVFYSVIRTSVAQPVAETLAAVPDGAGLLAEYLWTVLPSLAGGTFILDQPLAIRSIGRRRPNYGALTEGFAQKSSISEWKGWPGLTERMRMLAGRLGTTPGQMGEAIAAMEADNWVFPREAEARVGSGWASTGRALLSRASYLACPRALFSYSERVVLNGLAERGRARCRSYPWIQEESFESTALSRCDESESGAG